NSNLTGLRGIHPNGQTLQAVHEIRPNAPNVASELEPLHAVDELLEEDSELELRQMGTEAKVRPSSAEGQMVGGVARDVEPMGLGVVVGVAVGGSEPDDDFVPSADLGAAERDCGR